LLVCSSCRHHPCRHMRVCVSAILSLEWRAIFQVHLSSSVRVCAHVVARAHAWTHAHTHAGYPKSPAVSLSHQRASVCICSGFLLIHVGLPVLPCAGGGTVSGGPKPSDVPVAHSVLVYRTHAIPGAAFCRLRFTRPIGCHVPNVSHVSTSPCVVAYPCCAAHENVLTVALSRRGFSWWQRLVPEPRLSPSRRRLSPRGRRAFRGTAQLCSSHGATRSSQRQGQMRI
jgi:hypothetical protein